MSSKKIDLGNCTLELDDSEIVELFIKSGETLQTDKIREIFDTIHRSFASARGLLVSAGDKATLSPEARELVSSEGITDIIVADAIVIQHYYRQMSSNFFVRYNKPSRPTKIFKSDGEAREWLRDRIAEAGG